MTEPHGITVSHIPLDSPGVRVLRSDTPQDVKLHYLREILETSEENLKLTETALQDPALRDLARAVRAALVNLEALTYHLIETHQGIADGKLNYSAPPRDAYPDGR